MNIYLYLGNDLFLKIFHTPEAVAIIFPFLLRCFLHIFKISFFLYIRTLSAASLLGIYNIYKEGSAELNFLAVIAIIFSFIFSYITIIFFLNFIKKFSLNVFVIYRLILSAIILGIVYL